jgi:uncharacterized protein YjbI with pentapeptide repeats
VPKLPKDEATVSRRYALCVGIGTYTQLTNRSLRYAVTDAEAIAERLSDPQRGNFEVTLLIESAQTTKDMLGKTLYRKLNALDLNPEDMVVIYISCHGDTYGNRKNFCLLPSDAQLEEDGTLNKMTVIDVHDVTKTLSNARVKNIIFLLDVCHSGGAGSALQRLDYDLNPDTNLFIIGAARHDQVATQSSTLQHGLFTSCLLQAFEQKPHRSDGWLTISDVHSFVSKVIQEASRFSGQESPVQIQAWSASVNPNLLLVKNPHYSTDSYRFHEEVKKLLELVQYEPVGTAIPEGAPAGFYVAEIKAGVDTHRVGIIPYYNQVVPLTPENAGRIMLFVKEQVERGNLDGGLLVTALELSNEVRGTLQESRARYLKVRTYESIWKNLIDFNKYLQKLVNEYQTAAPERGDDPPLAEVYIPLHAERRQYVANMSPADVVEMKSTGKSGKRDEVTWEDLETEVKRWLCDPDPTTSRLALLADYGSGKTTFCQHLAATLAEVYLTDEEHARYQQRIPLLIPLRNFGKNPVDLEGYLVSHLKQYCRVHNADAQALMKMAEAGLLLFLLDGFDEMASRATTDTVRFNVELFEHLANIPQNKVLLTTRPEYFLTLHQEQQVLQAYPRLYLRPFNKEQIDLYLQKRVPFLKLRDNEPKKDWTHYRKQINSIHDLSDLVHRPVLLEMIIKTLPVLVAEGEVVNRPNLYQRYLEGELDRQLLKQRRDLLIKREKRFEIVEHIALDLYLTDKAELTSKRIQMISSELLTQEQQDEMEGSLREIVTCSFLIRTGDAYRFSHQSFLEYLVALHLAKDIMHKEPKNLQVKPLTLTIRDFLVELEVGVMQGSSSTAGRGVFNQKRISDWFQGKDKPDEKYKPKDGWMKDRWLGGNIVSLLAGLLPPAQLLQLPLSEVNLAGVILAGIDLSGVISHAAYLGRAILVQSNLERANLVKVNLSKMYLRGANLTGANLTGANLTGADLTGADLTGANLTGANLTEANLTEANLTEAIVTEAIVTEANLTRAIGAETDLKNKIKQGGLK